MEFLFDFLTRQDQIAAHFTALRSATDGVEPGFREALIVAIFYKACSDFVFGGRLSAKDEDELLGELLVEAGKAHRVEFKPGHIAVAKMLMASNDAGARHIVDMAVTALKSINDPEFPTFEILGSLPNDGSCKWDFAALNIRAKTSKKCPKCKKSLSIEGTVGLEYDLECPSCKNKLKVAVP